MILMKNWKITNLNFRAKNTHFKSMKKYVGVQSWKALHLPTLDIRVKQKGNRALKWEIHVGFL